MKLLFMGRKPAAAEALRWSLRAGFDVVGVITDADNPDSETARIARRRDLALLDYEGACELVADGRLEFDVGVSFVFWKIIDEPLLDAPGCGIINFHPAPLPEYRGTAGYNVAILEGLDRWAVTAHYMEREIDAGGIIDSFEFSIDPVQETARTLERKSQRFMLDLYRKTMRRVLKRGTELETRPNDGGRYISRAKMEKMKRVEPGDDIDRKIRAFWFPPYHGAFIELDGQKYTLVNERILEAVARGEERPVGPPRRRGSDSEDDVESSVEYPTSEQ